MRSRWYTGQFRVLPRLSQLRTNTIWASQAQTLTQETLGSSTGNPHQRFQTTQFPVLPGQDLAVRVAQLPSALEQADIRNVSGEDAITLVHDEVGQLEEVWIRWQAVPDFYGSSGRDRHYTLNHLTGEVCFGDGQNGSVPPPGLNNIRLMHYRTGGGQQGNRAADTITQLKTTVPYIDRVTNGEAAAGGAEQESLAQVQARGPKQLRHRGRAVTAQDFEDLAFEASPEVARALAMTPRFDALGAQSGVDLWLDSGESPRQAHRDVHAGQVAVLIVSRSETPQPVPSLALIDRVEAFIRSSCIPTLSVQVSGPRWIEVLVSADVVPQLLETGDAVRTDIIYQLNRFLHPLTGGADGQGWDFGREPHESDFYGLMESVAGVVRVRSLHITLTGDRSPAASPYLIFPGRHQINLVLDPISSSLLVSSLGGV
ncbi:MAG: putative baseplate assembly protein [Phormidesmis priestleyi]|uniref:Putative baseplate assembly protein n=1 Tax=Phormidesmis priestleyi TaxID=268141 RepID=A0A2W4YN20_9CYAN|nr:MAG: putative baseplate assembly protein [Phormidesmis priestleyi]